MKTTEVLQQIDIPRAKLYYLELKGYICPRRIPRGDQEIRDYSQTDMSMIKFIWMYLKKGYKLKMAHRKALQKLNRTNRGKLRNGEQRSPLPAPAKSQAMRLTRLKFGLNRAEQDDEGAH